jgi:predicted GIY-YIG superfamily endonuclease
MSRRASSNNDFPIPQEVGDAYLIHLEYPLAHARHYKGFSTDLPGRIRAHRDGTSGVRFMEVVRERGIPWHVSRVWKGVTREQENRIKERGGARPCPDCKAEARQSSSKDQEGRTMTTTETRPVTEYMKGAGTADQIILAQAEHGMSPEQIEESQAKVLDSYDPDTATPEQAEWHQGYRDTAQMMVGTLRDMERAELEGDREAG